MKDRFFLGSVILLVPALFSCQLGLGSAVDAAAPTISITSPATASVVSGVITFEGECNDDQAVKNIRLTLTNSDSHEVINLPSKDVVLSADKKRWSYTYDTLGKNIPDANYIISAEASDGIGRVSQPAQRNFDIDNTPPVFVLTSPNTVDISDPTVYGTKVTITGEVADDHAIKSMSLFFYDDNGTLLTTEPLVFNEVETTGGTSVVAARFDQAAGDVLNKNYEKIYDTSKSGSTQYRRMVVSITDQVGNTSNVSYIKSDLFNKLSAEMMETPELTSIRKIMNGSFVSDRIPLKYNGSMEKYRAALRKIIEDSSVSDISKSKETWLALSINSKADPTYEFSGYKYSGKSDEVVTLATGTKVQFQVSSGLNGDYVDPATICVKVYEASESGGGITKGSLIKTVEGDEIQNSSGMYLKVKDSVSGVLINNVETTFASGTFSLNMPAISAGQLYVIEVEGRDVKNNSISAKSENDKPNVYCVKGQPSGKPAVVSVDTTGLGPKDNPANLSYVNFYDMVFRGTFTSDTPLSTDTKWTLTVTSEENSSTEPIITGDIKITDENGRDVTQGEVQKDKTYNWKAVIGDKITDGSKFANSRYQFDVIIFIANGSGTSSTVTRTIHMDSEKPETSALTVSPVVVRDGTNYVNGTVAVSASIKEPNMKEWKLYANGTSVATGNTLAVEKSIDTTAYEDLTDFELKVEVTDKAGNKIETIPCSYGIKQSTDKPAAEWTNVSKDIDSAEKIKEAYTGDATFTNILNTSSNSNLMATITDDDGIKSVVITATNIRTNERSEIFRNENVGGVTSYTISKASIKNLSEGLYKIKLSVQDSVNASTGNSRLEEEVFVVAVDNGAPVISVTTEQEKTISKQASHSVAGTWKDASGVTITRKIDGAAEETPVTVNADGTWTDNFTSGENGETFVYTATDAYGQVSVARWAYSIDSLKPEVAVSNLTAGTAINNESPYYKSSSLYNWSPDKTRLSQQSSVSSGNFYTISGNWSDTQSKNGSVIDGTGTKEFYISIDGGTTWREVEGLTSAKKVAVNWSFDLPLETEGNVADICFKVKDAAGNESDVIKIKNVSVDFAVPVVELRDPVSTYYRRKNIFRYEVKDSQGIKAVDVSAKKNGAAETSGFSYRLYKSDGTTEISDWADEKLCILELTVEDDGKWEFNVKASDKSDRESSVNSISFVMDKTAPVFGTGSGAPHVSTAKSGDWYKSTELKIAGTVSDATTGIDKVEYTLDNIEWRELAGTNNWSGSISGLSNGSIIYLRATDIAGNVSEAVTISSIKIDISEPVISSGNVAVKFASETNYHRDSEVLSNKGEDVDVIFWVKDEGSGLNKVYVSSDKSASSGITASRDTETNINSHSFIKAEEVAGFTRYKATVPKAEIENGSVYAFVYDEADNNIRESLFTFNVDTDAPVLVLNNPADADNSTAEIDVNKIIVITGTAADNSKLNRVDRLEYKSGNSWIPVSTDDAGSSYLIKGSYSFTAAGFDTTRFPDNKQLLIRAVGVDGAGNFGYSNEVTLNVNQDTDRPVVKVTSVNRIGEGTDQNPYKYNLKYGTNSRIEGNLKDDDSTASAVSKVFIASGSQIKSVTESGNTFTAEMDDGSTEVFERTGSEAKYTFTSGSNGTTTFVPSSGDWTFTPSDTNDGTKTVYFYVKDNNGKEFFTSSAGGSEDRPKFAYKTENPEDSVNVFSYVSDNTSPIISSATARCDGKFADTNIDENLVLGGRHRGSGISVRLEADDANGIDFLTMKITYRGKTSLDASTDTEVVHYYTTYGAGEGVTTNLKSLTGEDQVYTKIGEGKADPADSRKMIWTASGIDLINDLSGNLLPTGNVTVEVNAYDNCNLKGNSTYRFALDNLPPAIKVNSPLSSEEKTGRIVMSGETAEKGAAETVEVSYCIPTKEQMSKVEEGGKLKAMDDESVIEFADAKDSAGKSIWNSARVSTSSITNWQFEFADATSLTNYDSEDYCDTPVQGIYNIPVYVKAQDSNGNFSIVKHFIKHNPDGDRPRTELGYPTETDYDAGKDYVTLGGSVRVTGTSQVPSLTSSTKAVYIQISGGTDFNRRLAETYISRENAGKAEADKISILNANDAGISSGLNDSEKLKWWGIKANSSSSTWSVILNSKGGLEADSGNQTVYLRACGVNAEGKAGAWSDSVRIEIDKSAPTAEVSLRQFKNNNPITGEQTSHMTYDSGMYLKGTWFFTCEVVDESDIDEKNLAVIKKVDGREETLTEGINLYKKAITSEDGTKKGYALYVQVPGNGKCEVSVTAQEKVENPHIFNGNYSFNLDNNAPAVTAGIMENGMFSVPVPGQADEKISDANYQYNIGAMVTDEDNGSGFERMFFYFRRSGTCGEFKDISAGSQVFLDPITGTKEKLSGLDSVEIEMLDTTKVKLYGRTYEGSQPSGNTLQFTTNSSISADKHIREGGIIYIGGRLRRINGISGNTVSFDSDASGSESSATFIYAQVVENQNSEKVSVVDGDLKVSNDDDDGMFEKVTHIGNLYKCEASIQSSKMEDGPVSLVLLGMDKAGNVSETVVDTFISNRAPRIAKISLGTDLDGNGAVEGSEINEYSTLRDVQGSNGTRKEAVEDYRLNVTDKNVAGFESGRKFVAKAKSSVGVEIVGGNGELKYSWNYNTSADGSSWGADTTGASVTSFASSADGSIEISSGESVATRKNVINLAVSENKLAGKISDGYAKLNYKVWDSTVATTCGTNSQSATFSVALEVDVRDEVKPNAYIAPFFWKSSTVNSLAKEGKTMLGHIELPEDLEDTELKTMYGDDPKVSGKIVFRGYAYDDVRLTKLSFAFNGRTSAAAYAKNGTQMKWSVVNGAGHSLEILESLPAGETADMYNGFEGGTVPYQNQDGHKVFYRLTVDTAQGTNIAAKDQTMTLEVEDASSNSSDGRPVRKSASDTDDRVRQCSIYQMDVVPYVVKVETGLSKQKKSNWSVYNRSALGHYPVQSVIQKASTTASGTKQRKTTSEYVTLHGFNLNGGDNKVEIKDKSNANLTVIQTAQSSTALSQLKFNVETLASGKLDATVNGIKVINNINNNDAMGDAKEAGTANANKYNMQGNGDTNNILTDDLVFDVWEFNDRAAVPINGMATGVQMQVNQVSKMLNFAFANGGLFYSVGGRVNDVDYSSIYWAADWDTFAGPCTGLAVDSLGNVYSVDSGGDTNNSGSVDKYNLYTSRWGLGRRDTEGTLSGSNARRLEEIAYKTGGGTFDYSLMKYRYLSSELATSVSGNTTNLYLVNYDALTDEIRFRAGAFADNTVGNKGGFFDEYTGGNSSYYSTNNCQVIANNSDSGGKFPANGGTTTVQPISGRGAGQYVDIAIAKNGNNDVACVVWYDAYDNCLKYSYAVDPVGNWNKKGTTTANRHKGNNTAWGWSTPTTIFSEGGEYCQIAVDANNHLHIAAYAGNGDVKYAYLDVYNYDYDEAANSCTVDASGSVGEHLTLDVALDGNGNSIPYIGYFTSAIKAPKYAYLVDTTHANKVPAGVDDDERFTGAWEVTVVPTSSRPTTNREDKINIGVFKTTAGVLNWSTTDGKAPGTNNIGTNEASSLAKGYGDSAESSKAYGNGSKNAVFAYQISGGTGSCIETAQMR